MLLVGKMNWKESPVLLLVIVTQLQCGYCRHQSSTTSSSSKISGSPRTEVITRSPHYPGPKIPGIPITHLTDLSVLDPYNIMSGKSFESQETASLVHQIIPLTQVDHKTFDGVNSNSTESMDVKTPVENAREKKKTVSKKVNEKNLPSFHGVLEEKWPLGVHDRKPERKAHRKHRNIFSRVEHGRNVLLHDAVRKLLGFSETPPAFGKGTRYLPDPRKELRLPRYVKDLYKRFQSGEIGATALAKGNTVRSIHTSVDTVRGQPMFLFNVSSVRVSEKLLSAEIHLYKRRLRRWMRSPTVQVVLYQVAPHFLSQIGKITVLESSKPGWQWYDVSAAVDRCLAGRKLRKPYLFGLSFYFTRGSSTRSLPLKKFGRHHSMPFLVVYSNDTESVSFEQLDHLAGRLFPSNKEQTLVKSGVSKTKINQTDQTSSVNDYKIHDSNDKLSNSSKESRRRVSESEIKPESKESAEKLLSSYPKSFQKGSEPSGLITTDPESLKPAVLHHFENHLKRLHRTNRKKRSILTNEIPQDPTDYEKYLHEQKKFKAKAKTQSKIAKSRDSSILEENDRDKSGYLPSPDVYAKYQKEQRKEIENERRRRKNRRRKRKKKHRFQFLSNSSRRQLGNPSDWGKQQKGRTHTQTYNRTDESLGIEEHQEVCGRRKLVVDFADIGWEDWIIAPQSFDAHYCAGECLFPLTKRLRPSNHATIQSIVHAVGIYDKVPAPCCVPDEMSPLSLLYFDQDKNVVLKTYPGMTVDTCACR